MPDCQNLLSRLVRRGFVGQLLLAALVLGSAGTLKFWQGWAFMAVNLAATLGFCIYFYRHDPQLLARRMLTKEKVGAQKIIMLIWKLLSVPAYLLAGFDHRFGWSRQFLMPVPGWLTVLALLLIPAGYLLFYRVLKANRYAASIIQVETGQTVTDTGPYQRVRHPMYSGFLLLWLAAPLALGSFFALPAFALALPLLVFRLLNEEKFLRRELPGYAEYCRRTPCRLIPFVW
jgi:protein-S-isoprenylcysteine O-methyltransferase Ste14